MIGAAIRAAWVAALVYLAAVAGGAAQFFVVPPIPTGTASIGTPVALGTRSISGVTTACNITTTAAIASGDLVIVVVQVASSPLRTVSSVSDGTNTYAQAVGITGAGTYDNEIWYKANATAVGSAATITVSLSAATNNNGCAAEAFRVSGLTATPFDQSASQSATTASPSVTSGALAQPSELVIGATFITSTGGTPFTEANGYHTLVNALAVGNGNGNISVSYAFPNSTAPVSYSPAWSSGSLLVNTVLATFKGS